MTWWTEEQRGHMYKNTTNKTYKYENKTYRKSN